MYECAAARTGGIMLRLTPRNINRTPPAAPSDAPSYSRCLTQRSYSYIVFVVFLRLKSQIHSSVALLHFDPAAADGKINIWYLVPGTRFVFTSKGFFHEVLHLQPETVAKKAPSTVESMNIVEADSSRSQSSLNIHHVGAVC